MDSMRCWTCNREARAKRTSMKLSPADPNALASGTSPWRHLPNLLSGLRMLLVVPLVWLIRDAQYDGALLIAACAGATDALNPIRETLEELFIRRVSEMGEGARPGGVA